MKKYQKRFLGIGDETVLFDDIRCRVKHIPLKRIFDISFSSFILLISLPIIGIISLLIKLFSKGPIFYSHERIGRGGDRFKCYKFRTMYPDAEIRLKEILQSNPDMKREWELTRKLQKDPRVIPIGNILRKTSLDELPQFWNVLKGDLSVVGPRPVVEDEMEKHFGLKAGKILSIRPGITGIWQVSGRNDTSYNKRVMLDEKYVDQRSMMLDLKLIAKTIPSMITSKGAY
ncbi:MAG: sugar transferase [Chlamydiota bacterium]|nr:sugar transferase [Chlamydiota bacterium]